MFICILTFIVLSGAEYDQLHQMKGLDFDHLLFPLHVQKSSYPLDKYKSLAGIF